MLCVAARSGTPIGSSDGDGCGARGGDAVAGGARMTPGGVDEFYIECLQTGAVGTTKIAGVTGRACASV